MFPLLLLVGPALAIDLDGDGYEPPADCNETFLHGASQNPGEQEVIGDSVDQDCDGNDALRRHLVLRTFSASGWTTGS